LQAGVTTINLIGNDWKSFCLFLRGIATCPGYQWWTKISTALVWILDKLGFTKSDQKTVDGSEIPFPTT